MATPQPPLRFTGHKSLAHRLVMATLTGRPVQISQIRSSSPTHTGIQPYEMAFIRLLELVTNGSHMEISYTGTSLLYKPGLITGSTAGNGADTSGSQTYELPAANTRALSYFLIPLCMLAPFSKAPFSIRFTGPGVITAATPNGDVSVETVRNSILPLFNQFAIFNKLEIQIEQRSCLGTPGKSGGGRVHFLFGHQVRLPKTLHLLNPGRVKKIRGVAYSIGVSGSNNARMIDHARGILNQFAPDTYIYSDVSSPPMAPDAKNPGSKKKIGIGFGLSLVAESSTKCYYSADAVSPPTGGEPPEDIGRKCAFMLLESVAAGGCVAPVAMPTMVTLMAMGSEDVGRLRVGKDVMADKQTVTLARDLVTFGMAGWGVRPMPDGEEELTDILLTIVGRGIGNVGRKMA